MDLPVETRTCPMCGSVLRDRIVARMTHKGEVHYVDRICRGCGWVDLDDEGGEP